MPEEFRAGPGVFRSAFGASSCQPQASAPTLRLHSQAARGHAARAHEPRAHNDVDLKQKREFSDGLFNQSHGSFDIVFAPVILALLGLGIDKWLSITPVCTITLAVLGMIGAFAKVYYSYRAQIDEQHARRAGAGLP